MTPGIPPLDFPDNRESVDYSTNAFDQASTGMAIVAPGGRVLRANQRLGEMFGLPPQALLEKSWQELTPREELERDLEFLPRLLAGDIEQAQEAQLVARAAATRADRPAAALRADVLLVPHHGSKTSSSEAFLDAVQPRFAIVQAGYRNRFGHPVGSVLVRYDVRHIKLVDTPRCGAVTWLSWEPDAMQCARKEQKRYWHHEVP